MNAKAAAVKWDLCDLAGNPKEARDLIATEALRLEMMRKEVTTLLESVVRSLNDNDYQRK